MRLLIRTMGLAIIFAFAIQPSAKAEVVSGIYWQKLPDAIRIHNEQIWYNTILWNETIRANEEAEARKKQVPPKTQTRKSIQSSPKIGSGRCGGNLPPCSVMMRESGGNIHAYNPTGCGGRGCYGKWQCDPRSCNGTGTEAEQDAEAAQLWNGGAGCGNWAAC